MRRLRSCFHGKVLKAISVLTIAVSVLAVLTLAPPWLHELRITSDARLTLRTFLTASALVAVVALVWIQLWERAEAKCRKQGEGQSFEKCLREFWLRWCYLAVLLVLVSFLWAVIEFLLSSGCEGCEEAHTVSMGVVRLLLVGLGMTAWAVTVSLLSGLPRLLCSALCLCGRWLGKLCACSATSTTLQKDDSDSER